VLYPLSYEGKVPIYRGFPLLRPARNIGAANRLPTLQEDCGRGSDLEGMHDGSANHDGGDHGRRQRFPRREAPAGRNPPG
jgi:hypothetical protein